MPWTSGGDVGCPGRSAASSPAAARCLQGAGKGASRYVVCSLKTFWAISSVMDCYKPINYKSVWFICTKHSFNEKLSMGPSFRHHGLQSVQHDSIQCAHRRIVSPSAPPPWSSGYECWSDVAPVSPIHPTSSRCLWPGISHLRQITDNSTVCSTASSDKGNTKAPYDWPFDKSTRNRWITLTNGQ